MSFIRSIPMLEESVSAVMKRYPEQAVPLIGLADIVMRTGKCQFSAQERELIGAFASGTNACTYCYNTHKATAEAFGVNEDLLENLLDDIDTSAVDDNLKPVLHYVKKLTESPSRMLQADVDAIFAAGWDEDSFHFTVMICALFNMMNRIMDGYGVKNTAEFRQSRGAMLAVEGYG
jgi:uncharacterized peroxidase-related enzyme